MAEAPPEEAVREYRRLAEAIASTDFQSEAYGRLERETRRIDALIRPGDRSPTDVVLRRTRALLAYLTTLPGAPDLTAEAAALEALAARAAAARRPTAPTSCFSKRGRSGGESPFVTRGWISRRFCSCCTTNRRAAKST